MQVQPLCAVATGVLLSPRDTCSVCREEDAMIGTRRSAPRFRGSGDHLRLRVPAAPEALVTARELSRGSVAVEKALGESVRDAVAAGHSWSEIGDALGVGGSTAAEVRERYETSRRDMRSRL